MYIATGAIASAVLLGTVSVKAHIALWDNAMFGLNYPYQSTDTANTQWNAVDPVNPLRESDAFSEDQWFAHGYKSYPPAPGVFMTLPSGGTYRGEVGCNRAVTSLRNPDITDPLGTYACPGDSGVGALHVENRYNETVDNKWFGGTALAIAYTSDETTLRPNDLTVISIVQNSVWYRQINYAIPSGLPPCPSGGCLCTWNWIHEANHGEGYPFEIYNVLFRCNVTGSINAKNTVKRGAVPKDCTGSPSTCVSGPKTPMYLYQADGNNLPHLDVPPSYNANWGFADGAQNDIFTAASTPAPTTYLANGYATATGTATGTASQPTATSLPSDWSALGCMIDNESSRTLPNGGYYNRNNNTISQCVSYCNDQGYIYAGTEYGVECWCSNTARLQATNATECNVPCPGDSFAKCGGSNRINVFMSSYTPGEAVAGTTTTTSGAAAAYPTASLPSGWASLGCSYDDANLRALNKGSTISTNLTVPSCIASCAKQGYSYAGVEYGQECWCGTAANFTAAGSGCNVPCSGDKSSICGGSYRINIYTNSGTGTASTTKATTVSSTTVKSSTTSSSISSSTAKTSTTSVKPSTTTSSSSSKATTASSSTSVKPTTTTTTTSKVTTTSTSTTKATTSSSTSSSKATTTTTSTSSVKPTTTSTTTSKAVTTTTTTSASATSTSVALPSGYKDLGCNIDTGNPRVLTGTWVSVTTNTPTSCIAYCSSKGYTYAGTEYGSQCWCGNTFTPNLATSGCTSKCSGDSSIMCGGSYRINVYGPTTTKTSKREIGRL